MPNTLMIRTASGRTLDEVKTGIRLRMQNMVYNALEIGLDLTEAKEACGHGEWLPFLREIGISASSAANYMRIAKEVSADSKIAQLPYTKILALLAAPADEREELATAAEDLSAAEIRKLTEERNKAAEAANMETARADQAEKNVESLQEKLQEAEQMAERRLEDLKEAREATGKAIREYVSQIDDLKARLLTAENYRVEVEVEKVPEDYEQIKAQLARAEKSAQELIDAAAEAEERANAAEAELEELRAEKSEEAGGECEKLIFAIRSFMMQCDGMYYRPETLLRDRDIKRARDEVARVSVWSERMLRAMAIETAEGAVV